MLRGSNTPLLCSVASLIIVNGILTGLDASHLADEYMEDDIVIEVRGQTDIDDTILAYILSEFPGCISRGFSEHLWSDSLTFPGAVLP